MPQLLTMVPFRPHHIKALKAALGEDWTITSLPPANQETPTAICSGMYDLSNNEMVQALVNADIVIGEPDPILLRRAADAGSRLKLVQMTWAGTDKYTRSPIPFPQDITLCCAVGGFGQIISQYVLAQTLGLMQNLPGYRDQQPHCTWKDLGAVSSLDGANVLIFGAGNIGGEVARRMAGFDCHITGVCRSENKARPHFDSLVTLEEADAALAKADVIIGAIPNNEHTAGWLNAARLATCKPGAVIVNVGRGNFIDCLALDQQLACGHLRGAALDVTNPEPLPPDHPLWTNPRCVITPHVSGGSFGRHAQTEDNICAICCKNLTAFLTGTPLQNRISPEDFATQPA